MLCMLAEYLLISLCSEIYVDYIWKELNGAKVQVNLSLQNLL